MSERSPGPENPSDSSTIDQPAAVAPVLAAGAICWRQGSDGELEVLLVRSARWDEWSWPKGKLDPGETLPECAVREVLEETGVQIELGVPLPSVSYVLPDGHDKTVFYWAARSRGNRPRTATEEEIAEVTWLSTRAARERLSRPSDSAPLDELLALATRTRLDTRPLLVLRHAKARSRAKWPGEEADRPLTGSGRRQADGVTGLIACWSPERILTSPWARCLETLQPYLEREGSDGVQPEVVPLLSERGLRNNPDRISETVADLLAGGRSALLCTHRPVLAVIVDAVAEATALAVRDQLPHQDPWLSPAEVLVAQVSHRTRGHRAMYRIHSVERYRPEPVRKLPS
ncbi:MAG TPA: NUDIX hydrolase [Kineosporiaceae bacterium]|nr:NUDIX hydrolase [Kineosporiaceae bacterium]